MKCYRCNGTGWTWQIVGYFGDGEADVDRDFCPVCDGSGKDPDYKEQKETDPE